MCVVCVLCHIVVPLPPGKNTFAVKINNNNNIIINKRQGGENNGGVNGGIHASRNFDSQLIQKPKSK
jgi:hypothetical protein